MAKLSEETLNEGRQHLINHDLDGFERWIDKNKIHINKETTLRTFERCFRDNHNAKALRLFEITFTGINPKAEALGRYLGFGCMLFTFLGLLGGVMYLLRSCVP